MSSDSSTRVYVITGANRGLGLGFVEQLVTRPTTLVYAGARDPTKADRLQQLAKQHPNTLRVVQLSVESDVDHTAVVQRVEAETGRVDVVIANAAIGIGEPVATMSLVSLRTQLEVNTIGPVRLFQHFLPLLSRSTQPHFINITSSAGSLARQDKLPLGFQLAGYGASKAAINLITRRIHFEHSNITALSIHPGKPHQHPPPSLALKQPITADEHLDCLCVWPCCAGWVQTDAGNAVSERMGHDPQSKTSTDESVQRVLALVDGSARDTHGGKVYSADDGKELPW